MTYEVTIDGKQHRVELTRGPNNGMLCRLDGRELELDAVEAGRDVLSIVIDGRAWEVKRERVGGEMHLMIAGERYAAEVRDPRSFRARKAAGAGLHGPKKLISPMPGKVVRVLVAPAKTSRPDRGHRSGSHEDAERDQIAQEGKGQQDYRRGRSNGECR